jgi:hypothetical protein
MSYGAVTWATQVGRARSAGSSKGSGTRTAKRKSSASARRAKKKKTAAKRRSLPAAKSSLWKAAQAAGWTDRQSFEDWAGDPSNRHEVEKIKARFGAYKETGR